MASYREKPCVVCGAIDGTVAHHIKTRGAGGNDLRENLITLCALHHKEVHDIGTVTFFKKYGVAV